MWPNGPGFSTSGEYSIRSRPGGTAVEAITRVVHSTLQPSARGWLVAYTSRNVVTLTSV
jgi:hypothetical protein